MAVAEEEIAFIGLLTGTRIIRIGQTHRQERAGHIDRSFFMRSCGTHEYHTNKSGGLKQWHSN